MLRRLCGRPGYYLMNNGNIWCGKNHQECPAWQVRHSEIRKGKTYGKRSKETRRKQSIVRGGTGILKEELVRQLCGCGCGEFAGPGKRFINYHAWIGKRHSEKTKKKMARRAFTEETKKKMSVSATIRANRSENIEKMKTDNPMFDKETVKKVVESRGYVPGWCKGLTKETDSRVAVIAEKCIGRIPSNKNQISLSCKWCSKEITRTPSQIERGEDSFCNKECFGLFHSREMKGKYEGPFNFNWKGGVSFEPYGPEFNEKLKEEIRDRDGRICQCCGKTELEHLQEIGERLIVHHIDYDKMNSKEFNLITLCNVCNTRANANRDYWRKFYEEKAIERDLINQMGFEFGLINQEINLGKN